MSTECSHCKNKSFKTFEDYARHILAKHADDEIRVGWAEDVLKPKEESVVLAESNPSSDVDAQLEKILRPEVLARIRNVPAPKEAAQVSSSEKSAEPNKKLYWVMAVLVLIIIITASRSVCY